MVFVCRAEARAWSGGTTVLVLVLLLSGCMAFWETPQGTARLMVGDVVVTGTESSALVSVVNMPGGGVAAIQFGSVGAGALSLSGIDAASVRVEGRNGFVVLAAAFDAAGEGALVAASGVGGVADGEVFRFTFDVTGPHPSVAVSKGRVSLVSAASLWIEDWEIADDAYYAR
jgi:hypothetical protein